MAYIGNNLDSDIQVNKYEYTATAGQTTFACTYDRAVDVYLNGVKLDSSDFTATNGTAVVLSSGANAGDIVDINAYFDVTYFNIDNVLPDQTGNSGKFLTTDGTNSSWDTVAQYTLPTQTGNAGKFLTTNGTTESWGTVDLTPYATTAAMNTALAGKEDLIPRQTTAPSSPSAGDLWWDSDNYALYVYDGSAWNLVKSAFSATGGTVTSSGGFTYHAFTSSGTFQITKGSASVDYLIVAGGGGAGYGSSAWWGPGGGGAGGLLTGTTTLGTGSYPIVIGAGGTGGYEQNATNGHGWSGSNTTALSNTSIGGGGGSTDYQQTGYSGGSGGGATYGGTPGSGTTGQGNRGGYSSTSNNGNTGGGGGGAGAQGTDTGGSAAGNGGVGLNMSTNFGTSYGESGWFSGGGGGGYYNSTVTTTGGTGGGGNGTTSTGQSGQANSGGGGGAGHGSPSGSGGSGIVILRYAS